MNTKQIVALATIISMVAVPVVAGDNPNHVSYVVAKKPTNKTNKNNPTRKSSEDEIKTPGRIESIKNWFKNEDNSVNKTKVLGTVLATAAALVGAGYACSKFEVPYLGSAANKVAEVTKSAVSYIPFIGKYVAETTEVE